MAGFFVPAGKAGQTGYGLMLTSGHSKNSFFIH
jgi:hypothetical protein